MNIDFNNALIYDWEAENKYLNEEIVKLLYKRDCLDMEFGRIVEELNDHLEKNTWLINGLRTIYDKEVSINVSRLKEIVDRIEWYDVIIADYRKHIEHNNRLIKKN